MLDIKSINNDTAHNRKIKKKNIIKTVSFLDIILLILFMYPIYRLTQDFRQILYRAQVELKTDTKYDAFNIMAFTSYDDIVKLQEKIKYDDALQEFDKGKISVESILKDVGSLKTNEEKLKVIRGLQNSYKEMPGVLIIDNKDYVIISNEDGMLSQICKIYFPIIESENQQRRENSNISNDEFFLLLFSRMLDKEKIDSIDSLNLVDDNFYTRTVQINLNNSSYKVILFKEKNTTNSLVTIKNEFLSRSIPMIFLVFIQLSILLKWIISFIAIGFTGTIMEFRKDYIVDKFIYIVGLYISLYKYSRRYVIILNFNIVIIIILLILLYRYPNNKAILVLLTSAIVAVLYNSVIINVETAIDDIEGGNFNKFKNRKGLGYKRIYNKLKTINEGYDTALNENIKNERMKSELITNVSHDLKTPLTSIINYVNILKTKDITEEERSEYLGILDKKTQKLKNLIFDLFEVSKLSSGKIRLNKQPIDLLELMNQCLGECTPLDNEKNIQVKYKTSMDKCIINIDGEQISRVIENLIINAYKYTLHDTRIYIDVYEEGNYVVSSFKNTSCYEMNFNSQEVFERFVRGDKARSSKIEGSGLGMAIAKSIVELHDGKVKVEIEGDMFKVYVYLPK